MRRAIAIRQELQQVSTVEDLTTVFESIASMKIGKMRSRVVESKAFFGELWETYRGLRINPKEQLLRVDRKKNGFAVLVAVTADGRLSGDVSSRVVGEVAEAYASMDQTKTDVVVLGSQGVPLLERRGIAVKQQFGLPESDTQISVAEIIELVGQYDQISVFYQTYESLRVQRQARIELVTAVRELGDELAGDADTNDGEAPAEIVSSRDYIFEPNIVEIANFLESLMMGVALTQVIMESKLAQYAVRFNSMNAAKHRAHDMNIEFSRLFHRAKRAESDDRLKETVTVVKELG